MGVHNYVFILPAACWCGLFFTCFVLDYILPSRFLEERSISSITSVSYRDLCCLLAYIHYCHLLLPQTGNTKGQRYTIYRFLQSGLLMCLSACDPFQQQKQGQRLRGDSSHFHCLHQKKSTAKRVSVKQKKPDSKSEVVQEEERLTLFLLMAFIDSAFFVVKFYSYTELNRHYTLF